MAQTNITRTYGTIHFEDLDPHRFEDLIRELIYDFKDWQTIEATGRSGKDEGFDIRAYEKVNVNNHNDDENKDEDENTIIHPMDGNLWMIQGKREKTITPKKIKEILKDVDSKNPPYGYILAASSNFSKNSYDAFREGLRKKGVMEFYLWGKGELEDMLHMPKNDRILFTFFGISLVSRKRLRKTEIRAIVLIKNKLLKLFGGWRDFYNEILVRDIEDTHYPYENEYSDFEEKPRWKKFIATELHPLGLVCHNHEYFAYVDIGKKEYDFALELDFVRGNNNNDNSRNLWSDKYGKIREFWDFLPKNCQAHLKLDGLIKFENIYVVDEKGDQFFDYPHIFSYYNRKDGPFEGNFHHFNVNNKDIYFASDYKRITVFPKIYQKNKIGKVYKQKKIEFNPESLHAFKEDKLDAIIEPSNKYNYLKVRDVISIANTSDETNDFVKNDRLIQITYISKLKIKDYREQSIEPYEIGNKIFIQLGRDYDENEIINVYEFRNFYKINI